MRVVLPLMCQSTPSIASCPAPLAKRYFRRVLTWLPPGVELLKDVSGADWVVGRLKPWDADGARLESFAPEGFEAYARVFHPAGFRPAWRGAVHPSVGRRWGDLARDRGVDLTPDIGLLEVSGIDPGDQQALDEIAPRSGELPPETCDALAAVLRPRTTTPQVAWFCLWEGNGVFWSQAHSSTYADHTNAEEIERYRAEAEAAEAQDALLGSTPRVEAYARSYFLFRGRSTQPAASNRAAGTRRRTCGGRTTAPGSC